MTKTALVFIFFFLLSSCKFGQTRGFRHYEGEVYFKLHSFGDTGSSPAPGDYLTVNISYLRMDDSLFFSGIRTLRLEESNHDVFSRFLTGVLCGDSLSLLIPPELFFHHTLQRDVPDFLKEEDFVKINLKLLSVQTEKEFEEEKELFLEWTEEYTLTEREKIEKYISEAGMEEVVYSDGYYLVYIERGDGPQVVKGKHISLHYEGRFLKGKFFDGTKKTSEPLDFIYGSEMFLIDGLDKVVGEMRQGDHCLVILPSSLAYGPDGSSTGIVPPYSILIYEVQIIKVE